MVEEERVSCGSAKRSYNEPKLSNNLYCGCFALKHSLDVTCDFAASQSSTRPFVSLNDILADRRRPAGHCGCNLKLPAWTPPILNIPPSRGG